MEFTHISGLLNYYNLLFLLPLPYIQKKEETINFYSRLLVVFCSGPTACWRVGGIEAGSGDTATSQLLRCTAYHSMDMPHTCKEFC
jgi:hypothetical protein